MDRAALRAKRMLRTEQKKAILEAKQNALQEKQARDIIALRKALEKAKTMNNEIQDAYLLAKIGKLVRRDAAEANVPVTFQGVAFGVKNQNPFGAHENIDRLFGEKNDSKINTFTAAKTESFPINFAKTHSHSPNIQPQKRIAVIGFDKDVLGLMLKKNLFENNPLGVKALMLHEAGHAQDIIGGKTLSYLAQESKKKAITAIKDLRAKLKEFPGAKIKLDKLTNAPLLYFNGKSLLEDPREMANYLDSLSPDRKARFEIILDRFVNVTEDYIHHTSAEVHNSAALRAEETAADELVRRVYGNDGIKALNKIRFELLN